MHENKNHNYYYSVRCQIRSEITAKIPCADGTIVYLHDYLFIAFILFTLMPCPALKQSDYCEQFVLLRLFYFEGYYT